MSPMLSLSIRVLVTGVSLGPGPRGLRRGALLLDPPAPLRLRLAVEQPDGGLPCRHAQLAQDGGDVAPDGRRRDEEALGGLGCARTLAHELEDVPLPPCQPGGLAVG